MLAQGRYREVVQKGRHLATNLNAEPSTTVRAAVPVGLALAEVGELAEALDVAESAMLLTPDVADEIPQAMPYLMQVRVAVMWARGEWADLQPAAGRIAPSIRWLAEAVGHLEVVDGDGYLGACLARLAQVSALAGQVQEARGYLERAALQAATRPDDRLREFEAEISVTAAAGDVSAARSAAVALASAMTGRPHAEALLLTTRCDSGNRRLRCASGCRCSRSMSAVVCCTRSPTTPSRWTPATAPGSRR
jgi:tetratricopeptide (TPR) repeat protein